MHWGAYESGKSWAASNAAIRLHKAENPVMLLHYWDFHSSDCSQTDGSRWPILEPRARLVVYFVPAIIILVYWNDQQEWLELKPLRPRQTTGPCFSLPTKPILHCSYQVYRRQNGPSPMTPTLYTRRSSMTGISCMTGILTLSWKLWYSLLKISIHFIKTFVIVVPADFDLPAW